MKKLSNRRDHRSGMVNESFEPTDDEEEVLEVLRDEWRVNPMLIRDRTGIDKGTVNTALTRLTSAGWVRKVTRGLYEYVDDPRRDDVPAPRIPDTDDESNTGATSIDGVLAGWRPGRSREQREARLASARAVLEYLRGDGELSASDFKADVYPTDGVEGQSADTWWRKTARGEIDAGKGGALALAISAGVVKKNESGAQSTYRWVGPEGRNQ
jgi:hypothetical protein